MDSEQRAGVIATEALVERQPVPGPTPSKMTYVPMYIRQKADYNFGETVTHEDYNAKFNIVADSLDYYAKVLFNLFNETNPEHAYHIPYLDTAIQDLADATNREVERLDTKIDTEVTRLDGRIDTLQEEVDKNTSDIVEIFTTLQDHEDRLVGMVDGSIITGHSQYADNIWGIEKQGRYRYYGTDKDTNIGFHDMPPAIYAEDIGEHPLVNPVDVEGIYYIPGSNSVAESMLTPELRTKVNTKITKYPELTELPQINNVTLLGNKSLADLGIQPSGNYLTSIPSVYVQRSELDAYPTTSAMNSAISGAISGANGYTAGVESNLNSYKGYVAGTYNRIGVNSRVANPIRGDMYVVV